MRLSLILPTYNCAGYLRETLASVLDRITEEYEVIVIDDGSDDETALCLGEFEGISEQIQIHYLSHRGVSIARNTGIEYATGDYVALLRSASIRHNSDFLVTVTPNHALSRSVSKDRRSGRLVRKRNWC